MYDYAEAVRQLENMNRYEMIKFAEQEAQRAERNAFSGKPGCVKQREMGSYRYANQMKALAFFLANTIIPAGASEGEIATYKSIAEILVVKGQLKPRDLDVTAHKLPEGNA